MLIEKYVNVKRDFFGRIFMMFVQYVMVIERSEESKWDREEPYSEEELETLYVKQDKKLVFWGTI